MPTELERRGDFSQSVLSGRVRNIYNPFTSTLEPRRAASCGTPFANNVIPTRCSIRSALKMLQQIPLPNLPGNIDNWQGSVTENVDYWNFSQRVDVNITRQLEGVRALRPVQGQPVPGEPDRAPASSRCRAAIATA